MIAVQPEPDNLLDILAQIQVEASQEPSSDIRDYVTPWEQFTRFIDRNPALYAAVRHFALVMARSDKKVGIKAIIERVRWEVQLTTNQPDPLTRWKINNTHAPYLARLLMEREPELEGFFETRAAAADNREPGGTEPPGGTVPPPGGSSATTPAESSGGVR